MRKFVVTIAGHQRFDDATQRYIQEDTNFEIEAEDAQIDFDKEAYVHYLKLIDDKGKMVFIAPNFKMCRVVPEE